MKNKILIFEDEFNGTIKDSFEMANMEFFNNSLEFEVKANSDNTIFECWKEKYSAVIVDLELVGSELDGYEILKIIRDKQLLSLDKVVVMTGMGKLSEKLKYNGFNPKSIKILGKPSDFMDIKSVLDSLLPEKDKES